MSPSAVRRRPKIKLCQSVCVGYIKNCLYSIKITWGKREEGGREGRREGGREGGRERGKEGREREREGRREKRTEKMYIKGDKNRSRRERKKRQNLSTLTRIKV